MSVTAARGFTAAGVAAGIKPSGALDLAVVAGPAGTVGAAVFTTNRAAAAPVVLSRNHLAASPQIRAVVANSGCANAATGVRGTNDALETATRVADGLSCDPSQVLVCSTGMIGTFLPMDAVRSGVDGAIGKLDRSSGAGTAAAAAILTTDTVVKEAVVDAGGYVVGGMAKGAGMIRPDMATMLAVLTTDAAVDADVLAEALRRAVDRSFHSLNVDGCASTNDTVIVLASGASSTQVEVDDLAERFSTVAVDLAGRIAADAEGASRVITLDVTGAIDDTAARRIGRAVADWGLVRASFYGGDPNWGRIIGAMGTADVPFDPDLVSIAYAGTVVAEQGTAAAFDEEALLATLAEGDFTVTISLGEGSGSATVVTTDLTPDYVRFNGERS